MHSKETRQASVAPVPNHQACSPVDVDSDEVLERTGPGMFRYFGIGGVRLLTSGHCPNGGPISKHSVVDMESDEAAKKEGPGGIKHVV